MNLPIKKIIFVLLPILFLLPFMSEAQILSVKQSTGKALQYSKSEWDISLVAQWENPYFQQDIKLDMQITSPSGKVLLLPCYHVSGLSGAQSEWRARFTPVESGIYQYFFVLTGKEKEISKSEKQTISVSKSDKKGFLRTNNLWTLKFDNGDIFRGVGENFCWESRSNDDSRYFKEWHENPQFNYDTMLTRLSKSGANFFRTWMIYWNLPVEFRTVINTNRYQNSTGYFNESGCKRMDELVHRCDSLGMYLMLALESHVGYMGEGWEISSYNKKNGGFAETPTEFFSSPLSRQQYKNKLRYFVARWGYSASIAAWEFFNEVDNIMYSYNPRISDEVVTDWHNEMSAYLTEIDIYKHLITTSISHRDVEGLNSVKNISINQKHIYKNTNGIVEVINKYVTEYKKPYVIGEFGYEWDWSKNFNELETEMISDYKRGLWYGLFSPTPVLPLSWWWEFFELKKQTGYFERVQFINKLMLDDGKGSFIPFKADISNPELKTAAVKCGNSGFVYIYNPGKTKATTTIKLNVLRSKGGYMLYNCETGIIKLYNKAMINKNILQIDNFELDGNSDYVIIYNEK